MDFSSECRSNGSLTPKDFLITPENVRAFPASPGDEIVISGMTGRFPNADNVEELAHGLYNKVGINKKINDIQ